MSIKAGQCPLAPSLILLGTSLTRALAAGTIFVSLVGSAHSSPGSREQGAVRAVAATLRGHVTNEAGEPLADARVLAAVPATDMRFVDPSTNHKVAVARTDANGDYWLSISGIARPTRVSIDAMKPGYGRLAGTLMLGGFGKQIAVAPGAEAQVD